jgi:hypothetical protein
VKEVRMPPCTESMRAARSMSTRPCRAITRSGRLWEEEHGRGLVEAKAAGGEVAAPIAAEVLSAGL